MTMLSENEALGISSIISENRQKRPQQVKSEGTCPFCIQNKAAIEQVFMEKITSDGEHIRIVNNKYPICSTEGPVCGKHDVVIETLHHHKKPHAFSKAHWRELLKLIQRRWQELAGDSHVNFIQVFKNEGERAGASIMHPHWQIVALEEVPLTMLRHYESVKNIYETRGCALCKSLKDEVFGIIQTDTWQLVVPKSARVPYETWIIPYRHISTFGELKTLEVEELADLLRDTLRLYEQMLPAVSYNICVMSGRPTRDKSYHVYISILPRTGNFAGFELATGCYINILNPQQQVDKMKEALEHLRGNNIGES